MRNTVKVFTPDEERGILTSLATAEFLGNGASRLVYECTDYAAELLNVDAEDYVIKVAMGLAGVNQNSAEIEFFLNHEYAPVAEIRGYGRFIEVMEKVEIDYCYRDFAEEEVYEGNEEEAIDNADYYDLEPEEAEEAFDVIMVLQDYFGHTSDNGQLGRTRNGDLVAYDYGFFSHSDDRQMASIDEMLSDSDDLRLAYLGGLLEIMEKSIEALDRYEKIFFERVDNDVDPNQPSYRYVRYYIYGFDKKSNFYKDIATCKEMVEYSIEQLPRYLVLEREYETNGLESEGKLISETVFETNMSDTDRVCLAQYIRVEK